MNATGQPPEGVASPLDTWVGYESNTHHAPMVAALRLAHSTFKGSYSWLLSGDDDTVFVVDNVLSMLRELQLDPSVPYFLSDDQCSAQWGPPEDAHRRCLRPHKPARALQVGGVADRATL